MSIEDLAKNFFVNNKDQILSIYDEGKKTYGDGLLFMKINDTIDVYYLNYEHVSDQIKNLCKDVKNGMYMYVFKENTTENFLITLRENK